MSNLDTIEQKWCGLEVTLILINVSGEGEGFSMWARHLVMFGDGLQKRMTKRVLITGKWVHNGLRSQFFEKGYRHGVDRGESPVLDGDLLLQRDLTLDLEPVFDCVLRWMLCAILLEFWMIIKTTFGTISPGDSRDFEINYVTPVELTDIIWHKCWKIRRESSSICVPLLLA